MTLVIPKISKRKPLFTELIAEHKGLVNELKSVDVAADLTILLNHVGMSYADLARKLGVSRARVSTILSGESNLTIKTVEAVARALDCTFDPVFRKVGTARKAKQLWEEAEYPVLESEDFGKILAAFAELPERKKIASSAANDRFNYQKFVAKTINNPASLNFLDEDSYAA